MGARYVVAGRAIEQTAHFISDIDEDDAARAANTRDADDWYASITSEMFG